MTGFGRQDEAAAGGEVCVPHLGDNGSHRTRAQAFLGRHQGFECGADFDKKETCRVQSEGGSAQPRQTALIKGEHALADP